MKEKALNSSNLAKAIQVKENTLMNQVLKSNSLLVKLMWILNIAEILTFPKGPMQSKWLFADLGKAL
jgi:hypothetical protein